MSDTETIDGTADELEPVPETPTPTTAVAVFDGNAGAIIRAEQPEEILAKATVIANALKGLIDGQGLAASMGGGKKHVEVGAWQACGALLGALGGQALHAETIWTRPVSDGHGGNHRTTYTASVDHFKWVQGKKQLERTTTYDVDGLDWEACVEVRTTSGHVVGRAEGMVSRSEEKWSRREDYALRSMAETRAESRAYRKAIGWIVHLAGYNPTPAEEMPTPAETGPPFGEALPADQKQRIGQALFYLLAPELPWTDEQPPVQDVAAQIINDAGGYFPAVVAKALLHVEAALRARLDAEPKD